MPPEAPEIAWNEIHLGRLLASASQRFDARVLALMARDEDLSLTLANLVRRGNLTAAHVQITRHLPADGCTLSVLAARASVSKQAIGKLVDQCAAWDLVRRLAHPRDGRSVQIVFTQSGTQWLQAYRNAVQQAEAEFRAALGDQVATVVNLGLEIYLA